MLPLTFDNAFLRELPGDPHTTNRIRQVHSALWSSVQPTPVSNPTLIAYSPEVTDLLGWSETDVNSTEFAQVFGGNSLLEGMQPYAANYGGHQFGSWAGQLGDGRAITLGETLNAQGQRFELQLKGAGPTPYSRRADGRAVLRSSLREFLCSEAMYHLGIPTTRALSLVTTGDYVVRDMFYDGHPQAELGAIVCRVAPSFIRFGNFELPASRGDLGLLGKLIDFTIERDYPELQGSMAEKRLAWFNEICKRTAIMVAHWMRVGFVHGVMNTDNMSILGLTLDYGPYGWLEDYDPMWTPNTTDAQWRRYSYGQQPFIGHWNLMRLRDALACVIPDHEQLNASLKVYADTYSTQFRSMLAAKFGVFELVDDDATWVNRVFELMHQTEVDMTLFFRKLASIEPQQADLEIILPAFYRAELFKQHRADWQAWLNEYSARLEQDCLDANQRRTLMNNTNPYFILRNYLAQQAIDKAAQGDNSMILELQQAMRQPYKEQPTFAHFAEKRPDWARHKAGCSMLSCSS